MMCESMEVRGQTEARKKIIREELQFFFLMKKETTMTFDKMDRTNTIIESWQLKQKYQEKARTNKEKKGKQKKKFLIRISLCVENETEDFIEQLHLIKNTKEK